MYSPLSNILNTYRLFNDNSLNSLELDGIMSTIYHK